MNPHSFTAGYQPVYQIYNYQTVLPQFQLVSYPLPTTAIPNVVQSISKPETTRTKNMLCITDPNTLNVIVPSKSDAKDVKKDDIKVKKQTINKKFKEQISNRAKEQNSNQPLFSAKKSTTNLFLQENKSNHAAQAEKAIAEIAAEAVLGESDDYKSEQEQTGADDDGFITVPVLKQVKMPFEVPKPNAVHQSIPTTKFKITENFYPDPSLAYPLCYSCNVVLGQLEKNVNKKLEMTELIKEIQKNDRNQPKNSYVYNSEFLRLIDKIVSNCSSSERLCAREQLLLEQPKCIAPSKDVHSSQSKFMLSRNKYNTRNSSDNKRHRKPYVIRRSSIERKVIERAPSPQKQTEEQPTIELKRTKNAWKPKRSNSSEETEELKNEKIKKIIRSLLNKMTPTNFKELEVEFLNLRVSTNEASLTSAVDLIFDKAVEEPKFCELYSNLCNRQIEVELKSTRSDFKLSDNTLKKATSTKNLSETLGIKTFRETILTKCQKSFGINEEYEKVVSKLKEEIEAAEELDKSLLIENLEAVKLKEKRRVIGTIRFISQLYRRSIINIKILSYCIVGLIQLYMNDKQESYIEYITQFLEVIGPDHENQKASYAVKNSLKSNAWNQNVNKTAESDEELYKNIDKVFLFLYGEKENLSKRYKFMIMNLEELRANKWRSRGVNSGPKTIDEIHKEAEQEELRNEIEREEYQRKTTGVSKYSRSSQHGYSGRQSGDSFKATSVERLSRATQSSKNTSVQNATKVGSLSTAMKNDNSKLGLKRNNFSNRFE